MAIRDRDYTGQTALEGAQGTLEHGNSDLLNSSSKDTSAIGGLNAAMVGAFSLNSSVTKGMDKDVFGTGGKPATFDNSLRISRKQSNEPPARVKEKLTISQRHQTE